MRRLLQACLAASLMALLGCPSVATPRVVETRPSEVQRADAQRFDPFPEDDTGPEIEGGRPREYETPIAEPSRARWNPFTWGQRFGG